jgi:outer membrane protein OmpA-like peptidoglycan-associated protein
MDRIRPTTRRPRARRRTTLAAALAAALVTGACTDGLSFDGDDDNELGGGTLESWPQVEVAGSVSTPANVSDVTVEVHSAIRTPDELTTLFLDVTNEGNDDTTLGDVFRYDGPPAIRLYDPEANVEYRPLHIDDDIQNGGCLCSGDSVPVRAGETTKPYVTFAGLDADIEDVQVRIDGFTPLDDVAILATGDLADGTGKPMAVVYDDDLTMTVEAVSPSDQGTLVRVKYTNEGKAEPVDVSDFPQPDDLTLVDADGSAIFLPRVVGIDPVAGFLDEDELGRGESARAEVLMAGLPDDTTSVVVRGPGLMRSFPIPVGEESVTPKVAVPDSLEAEEIYDLASPTARLDLGQVPNAEPDLPEVDDAGPALADAAVVQTLTSEAQPGWSIAVRGVVRGPGDLSTLLVDVSNTGAEGYWPEGIGSDENTDDLGGITIVDPARQRLYGAYQSDGSALAAGETFLTSGDAARHWVAFPTLDEATDRVTVDIPTFGAVENVPVLDGPAEPEGDVPAALHPENADGLRMDVLEVGRMPGGNGTLVRTRLVNESNPGAVATPFAGEGTEDICDMMLVDPATGDSYGSLAPCRATRWTADLAEGDQLPFEARFPELPDDVESVVLWGGDWFPSAPIPVTDDAAPWYLAEPTVAESPEGSTYTASQGTADGAETTTREGDTVEVVLDTDVLFAFDSADLTPEASTRVEALAADIAEGAAGGTVTVTGHTDDVGDDAYNQTLSEQRAEAVRAALEPATGRSDLTYDVSGSGETDPVAPNEVNGQPNPDGQASNRRVTITYTAA